MSFQLEVKSFFDKLRRKYYIVTLGSPIFAREQCINIILATNCNAFNGERTATGPALPLLLVGRTWLHTP
jgi:hypothetical protein